MEFKEVRLETERLILRWFRADDFPAYLTMAQDPEVMKFLTGQPQTEIEAWKNMAAHIGHWYFRGYGTWAVEEKATGAVVGRIGLMNPVGWPGFECGWTLARASWGKGYATESAIASLEYGFEKLHLNEIYGMADVNNIASQKVLVKAGLTYIETFEDDGFVTKWYNISRTAPDSGTLG